MTFPKDNPGTVTVIFYTFQVIPQVIVWGINTDIVNFLLFRSPVYLLVNNLNIVGARSLARAEYPDTLNIVVKKNIKRLKPAWARRDSNTRSSPCEGDVIAN